MDAQIKYIKVVGGPPGGEGLVIALKDGSAVQVFINNPFPILLWKHHTALRCVDLSSRRNFLAIIDDNSRACCQALSPCACCQQVHGRDVRSEVCCKQRHTCKA